MATEEVRFPIIADDQASSAFRDVGRSAEDAAGKVDILAASLAAESIASQKSANADNTLVASRKAHAKAELLLADAQRVENGLATENIKLFADQGKALEDTGSAASGLIPKLQGLASPMAGLVAAGVVMAPTVLSIGFGLLGLGAAAYGVIKPIETAAQATGGLRANLHTLGPEQQTVARSLLGLGAAYSQFQQALQPTILKDFNDAIGLALPLMRSIEPVAAATGKALGGVLGQIGATFQSSEWQQFFQFMASTAGPDIAQLGTAFTNLLKALPPLAQALQPVNNQLLQLIDAATKAVDVTGLLAEKTNQATQSHTAWGDALGYVKGHLLDFANALNPAVKGVPELEKYLNDLKIPSQQAGDNLHKVASSAQQATGNVQQLTHPLGTTSAGMLGLAHNTQQAASAAQYEAGQVNALTSALNKGLTPLENYIGATITQANDASNLATALKASGDRIGLNTSNQRASFSAAQTYIGDLLNTASAAVKSHQGIDQQISSLQKALPALEGVRGKTAAYNAELAQLKGYLDQLRNERAITDYVTVVTRDVNQGSSPGSGVLTGGQSFHAAGGLISGGQHGRDSVPAMLMPGEVVVPTRMVNAGAVDHLRGSLPGFADGGQVPAASSAQFIFPFQSSTRAANYTVNVNVAPGGNLAEAGRQMVNAIRAFERGSGKSWRTV